VGRAIWQGSLTFGLVEIPVALLSAEKPHGIQLSMLDRRDFSPVGYLRYNKATEEEVPWAEIVRGYEHEKGQFVVLTDEDLASANPALSKTVDILRFVEQSEIEPIFYAKPYYLGPLKKKSKGYVLLRETMRNAGVVGIARIAIRTRSHVAAVGVRGDALLLHLLRYEDEIRAPQEIENVDADLEAVGVTSKEVAMAQKLVEGMTETWVPAEYRDEYTEDVLRLVEQKIAAGRTHDLSGAPGIAGRGRGRETGTLIDLMPLLKKSLEAKHRPAAPRARSVGAPAKRKRISARRGSKKKTG
jgi:DNA end-binding protein Ku